jgi:hypothetical protein
MPTQLPFRVFLSSPGDVPGERALALRLLHELPRRPWLRDRISIHVSAWDDPLATTPMDATRTPQLSVIENNTPPSQCDVTIVILWSRLGTRLPDGIAKPNGEPYRSGTEWELENARRASKPVWLYRRGGFAPAMDDPHYDQKVERYKAVRQFFDGLKDDNGALVGGWTDYDSEQSFETKLSQQLERELRRRLDDVPRDDERFRIFIAEPADEHRGWRGRIEKQLRSVPTFLVLDDVPPPYEPEEHAAATSVVARQADLCVHLVGVQPGAPLDAEKAQPDLTYPMEQLRVCLREARSQLILHPDGFRIESVAEPAYRRLIESARGNTSDRTRLEVISAVSVAGNRARDLILAKHEQLQQQKRAHAANAAADAGQLAAFVDVHPQDFEPTQSLLGYLSERLTTLSIDGDVSSPALSQQALFEDLVSRARFLIVVFGTVASQWVLKRLEEAVKIALEKRTGLRCGIYLRPGAPGWSGTLPGYSRLIDNAAGFDSGPIDSFLKQGSGG